LDQPGLLDQDIITPLGLATPHNHLQGPASGAYINAPPSPVAREVSGGDHDLTAGPLDRTSSTMIFSDLYKSPRSPLTKLRNSLPHAVPPPTDFDADLVSKDKGKQKEAVRRHLAAKVRNDWEFVWPVAVRSQPARTKVSERNASPSSAPAVPVQDGMGQRSADVAAATEFADGEATRDPGEEADSESEAESVYSTISEDPARFRPRAEWTSDLSDDEEDQDPVSPYRTATQGSVGNAVRTSLETKRTRRRRAVREEAAWNEGLACFEARRNAWTGARTVRVKPKPPTPASPSSTRRLFWRHHRTESSSSHDPSTVSGSPPAATSPLQATTTRTSQQTDTLSEPDSAKSATAVQRTSSRDSTGQPVLYPVKTLIPIPPPLLPPQNPMRASVTPSMYGSLYDKVVVQSLQPSCPVNLADMLRACVVGWKRDGEWPPKSSYPATIHISSPAEVLASRQRKAQQQQQANAARKQPQQQQQSSNPVATATTSKRMSLVGLLSGVGGGAGGSKPASQPKEDAEQGRGNTTQHGLSHTRSHSHSHSDEAGGGVGSSSKTSFRRSLHKVFSLGHQHSNSSHHHNAGAPLSPSAAAPPPSTKGC
ncbi:hypothetical protein N656DRAFT_712640, partial [Canariomyces notabilis]